VHDNKETAFNDNRVISLNDNKGFTLVEVMIAILVLALASGFIAEMFLVSARVNQRAQDIDSSVMQAIGIIETFKKQNTPLGLKEDAIFEGAFVQLEEDMSILTGYYDASWQPLSGAAVPSSGVWPEEAVYSLSVKIYENTDIPPHYYSLAFSPDGDDETVLPRVMGAVYEIYVEVFRLPNAQGVDLQPKSLATLKAQHYFEAISL